MKKVFVYAMAGALLMSSCGSYTASGAYTGSMLGSILGSAIGGLNDGPRGSDWGSILGMAGGAVVGAAIGSAADRAQEERIQQKREEIRMRSQHRNSAGYSTYESDRGYDSQYQYGQPNGNSSGYSNREVSTGGNYNVDSGMDPSNSGDDRIEFKSGNGANDFSAPATSANDFSSSVNATEPSTGIVVRNLHFADESRNRQLESNEIMRLTFEVRNMTSRTLFDIRPHVEEVSGMKNIYISPDARVESLAPGKGIRYTAMVKAGRRVKDGNIVLRVQAQQGNGHLVSNAEEITIPTVR